MLLFFESLTLFISAHIHQFPCRGFTLAYIAEDFTSSLISTALIWHCSLLRRATCSLLPVASSEPHTNVSTTASRTYGFQSIVRRMPLLRGRHYLVAAFALSKRAGNNAKCIIARSYNLFPENVYNVFFTTKINCSLPNTASTQM